MKSIIDEYRQERIPVELIKPSALNTYDPVDIQEFAENLKAVGLIHALCVCGPRDDGLYEIIAGERRYRAIVYARKSDPSFYPEVPCVVISDIKPDDCKQLVIEVSNLEQREFDKNKHRMRLVELVERSIEDQDLSRRQAIKLLSSHMKASPRYSDMYLTIAQKGSPEVRDMFEHGKIPAHIASNASHLDAEHQQVFVDRVKGGETPKAVIKDIYRAQREAHEPTATITDSIPREEATSFGEKNESPESETNKANISAIDSILLGGEVLDAPEASETQKASDISSDGASVNQSTPAVIEYPAPDSEPQFTEEELFEINNPEFDGYADGEVASFDSPSFSYTPSSNRNERLDIDTTGRFGSIQRARVDVVNDDEIEKLQNSVRRALENIRRAAMQMPAVDMNDFLDFISDWVDEMRGIS